MYRSSDNWCEPNLNWTLVTVETSWLSFLLVFLKLLLKRENWNGFFSDILRPSISFERRSAWMRSTPGSLTWHPVATWLRPRSQPKSPRWDSRRGPSTSPSSPSREWRASPASGNLFGDFHMWRLPWKGRGVKNMKDPHPTLIWLTYRVSKSYCN